MSFSSQRSDPIGIFDSGVGGLTVVRAVMDRLPFENIVYFGDTARVPYGVKSTNTITYFTRQIVNFLEKQHVKILIMACNTMASVAAEQIRATTALPVLDVIEAGAKLAVKETATGKIGVIGTSTTINSNAYVRAIHRIAPQCHIYARACPILVPLIEEGWLDHSITRLTVQEYLQPAFVQEIDTLVLGCTHYPLLKPIFREVIGPSIHLIDSAFSIAHQTAELLESTGQCNLEGSLPFYRYYVTDLPIKFQVIAERFLRQSLENLELIQL